MKSIIFISILILLSGCALFESHSSYIYKHQSEICATVCSQPIDTETQVTDVDTFYVEDYSEWIKGDSALMVMLFTCDSNNQVILSSTNTLQSKYSKLLYELNKGKLTIKALYDSIEVKNKVIHTQRVKTIKVTTKVPVYVNKDVIRKVTPWYWVFLLGASVIVNVWLGIKKGI